MGSDGGDLCLGGDSCAAGLLHSTLHNMARCAVLEGMWLLMRQSQPLFSWQRHEEACLQQLDFVSWEFIYLFLVIGYNVTLAQFAYYKQSVSDINFQWLGINKIVLSPVYACVKLSLHLSPDKQHLKITGIAYQASLLYYPGESCVYVFSNIEDDVERKHLNGNTEWVNDI